MVTQVEELKCLLRCRGIPRGCVETGQDHGGVVPRNRAKKRRTARRVQTDTVDKTEKDKRDKMSSMFNHEERQVCKLVGHHIRHLVL